MTTFLIVLHVLVCLMLLVAILLQPGKTPGMGSAFGGGGGGTFGAKSPTTILSRFTVVLAVAFMLSSLTLAWLSVRDHSVHIDPGEDTHFPSPGLALPGDLRVDPEGEEPDTDTPGGTLEGSDEPEAPPVEVVPPPAEEGSYDEDAAFEQLEGAVEQEIQVE